MATKTVTYTLTPQDRFLAEKNKALVIVGAGTIYGKQLQDALTTGTFTYETFDPATPGMVGTPPLAPAPVHPSLEETVELQKEGWLPAGDPQQVIQDRYTLPEHRIDEPEMTPKEIEQIAVATLEPYKVSTDPETGESTYNVTAAIGNVPDEVIDTVFGEGTVAETIQAVETESSAEIPQIELSSEQIEFERYHQENPAGGWYSNKDVAPYTQQYTGKIDWDEFNTDLARANLSSLIAQVGLEDAISQREASPQTSFQRQAIIEAKRLVEDPVTKELYSNQWANPYIDAGIFNSKREANAVFNTGGMQSVITGANAKIESQVRTASIKKSDIENKFLDESLLDRTNFIQQALSPVSARSGGFEAYGELLDKTFGEDRKFPDGKHPIISELSFMQLWKDIPEDIKQDTLNKFQVEKLSKEGHQWYEYMIPIYGTKLTIDERGWKSGWSYAAILGDILLLAPVVKGASVTARAIGTPTSTVYRVGQAAKGGARELIPSLSGINLKKSITAPITSVTDRLRYTYTPLAGIETSSSTVRIPVSLAKTPEKAMRIRDELMTLLAKGKKPVTTVDGITYELDRSMITSRAAHASPNITGITEDGAKINLKYKPDGTLMPASEQGLFVGSGVHSRFVPSSAFGQSPTGVEKGVALFGKSAEDTVSSNKLFKGTAELERKFEVGANMPKMTKKGFSRTATGEKFAIYTEEPLSITRRIATKLAEPFLEARSVFTPAIKVRGAKLGKPMDLLDEARLYDDAVIQAEKNGNYALAARLRAESAGLRSERLSRPLTRQVARDLSSEFTRAATLFRESASNFKRAGYIREANQTRVLSDVYVEAARVFRNASKSQKALDYYNRNLLRTSGTSAFRAASIPTRVTDTPRLTEQVIRSGELPDRPIVITPDRPILDAPDRIIPDIPDVPDRIIPDIPDRGRIITTEDKKKKIILPPPDLDQESKKKTPPITIGILAWRQGKTKGSYQGNWYVLYPPYKQSNLKLLPEPPQGATIFDGPESALRSLQAIGGPVLTGTITIDMGIQDIHITPPAYPGDKGGMKYIRDPYQRTTSDLTTKGVKIKARKPKRKQQITKTDAFLKEFWK